MSATSSKGAMMKRPMMLLVFVMVAAVGLRAEFQEIDLTIFGMD
jgi:hypothetical protein